MYQLCGTLQHPTLELGAHGCESRGVYSTGAKSVQAPTKIQEWVPGTHPEMTQVWLIYRKYTCVDTAFHNSVD